MDPATATVNFVKEAVKAGSTMVTEHYKGKRDDMMFRFLRDFYGLTSDEESKLCSQSNIHLKKMDIVTIVS